MRLISSYSPEELIELRLKIPNIDRVGLVLDISQTLAARGISIISMEVVLRTIYVEIEPLPDCKKQDIITSFRRIPGVIDVLEIDLMPHQEKTEQLNAVLASASDGILAIDDQAIITQCNPAAEKILGITAVDAIGQYLPAVFPAYTILLNILKDGGVFNNKEVILEQTHYLTSGRPIIDPAGRIIGAVAVLKDIGDVRDLINTVAGQQPLTFADILYTSKSMQRLINLAISYARGDSTILIRGETGVGKELFARALHAASPRKDKPFVTINCAAIPDTLLESELFGYESGAFTGAIKGEIGRAHV
jgi:transcriptional regulator of aroF, aroG, tyrA and aromatic amino acid transport